MGVPLELVDNALQALASQLPARIRVTEQGVIIYTFSHARALSRWRKNWLLDKLLRLGERYAQSLLAMATLLLIPLLLGGLLGNLLSPWQALELFPQSMARNFLAIFGFWATFLALGVLALVAIGTMQLLMPLLAVAFIVAGTALPLYWIIKIFSSGPLHVAILVLPFVSILFGLVPIGVWLGKSWWAFFGSLIRSGQAGWARMVLNGLVELAVGPSLLNGRPRVSAAEWGDLIVLRSGILTIGDVVAFLGCSRQQAGEALTALLFT